MPRPQIAEQAMNPGAIRSPAVIIPELKAVSMKNFDMRQRREIYEVGLQFITGEF